MTPMTALSPKKMHAGSPFDRDSLPSEDRRYARGRLDPRRSTQAISNACPRPACHVIAHAKRRNRNEAASLLKLGRQRDLRGLSRKLPMGILDPTSANFLCDDIGR